MCRLFGMHAGSEPAAATFWLVDSSDSLRAQSRRNPDGAGIGSFDTDDRPLVDKQPIAAWEDTEFAAAARELRSRTFVAHVRYASVGAHTVANTHPFEQDGRLFAHNGAFEGLDLVDRRLDALGVRGLVRGETDSERFFALITGEARAAAGDLGAGIAAAVDWLADHVPVYALNFVLVTPTELWALRYPEANELHLLQRAGSERDLSARTHRIRAQSSGLAGRASVIVASEAMDSETGWEPLESGNLVRVGPELRTAVSRLRGEPPAHPLTRQDLSPQAAASQHPSVA